jgi:hypothetical protein
MTIVDEAIRLSSTFPVFPCKASKAPACPLGFKAATSDPSEIRRLFNGSGALIGVPTGEASGFDVLDVDPRHGGDEWEKANQHRLPETRIHQTMGGGRHWLFRHVEGVHNSASAIAPGIDVRGSGGYVVVPPSPSYSVVSDAEIAHWPDWLLAEILPKTRAADPKPAPSSYDPIPSARLEGFVRAVLSRVSSAPEGQKHFILRNQAMILGGVAHLGPLSKPDLVRRLMDALPATALDRKGAEKTAEWGVEMGMQNPLDLPDRPRLNGHAPEEPPPPTSEHEGSEPVAEPDINPVEPSLPLLWFEDIQPVTDVRDFIQGVLLEQTAAVVYGESNAGKTFFATDMALHVAAGFPWNERRVEQGAVVYCALEGGIGFRNRVYAWKLNHGLDDKTIPFASIPSSINLLHPDADTPKLISSVNFAAKRLEMPVKLIVVDTLSRAMAGGDENSPEDMGALVVNMDRIRAETGAMVMFIHHSGKDAAKGARGHSLLRAAIDTEIEVVADPEGDKKSATVVKQRDLSKGSVFTFSLQVVEIGRNRHGEAVTSCTVTPLSVTDAALRHAPSRRSMADSVVHARQLLVNALAKHGAMLPPGPDYPENTSACATDRFREEFYAEMDGETPAAKRQAFFRAKKSLTDREIAVARGPYIWLARP